jgi:hypothetical protein
MSEEEEEFDEEEEYDEEEDRRLSIQSQMNQSQMEQQDPRGQQLRDLPPDVAEKLTQNVARLIILKHTQRLPVGLDEVRETIGKEYNKAVKEHIQRQAMAAIETTFGFETREIIKCDGPSPDCLLRQSTINTRTNLSTCPAHAAKKKMLILVQKDDLRQTLLPETLEPSQGEQAYQGLVACVTELIVLHHGEIKHDELWDRLKVEGLQEKDTSHPQLGNLKVVFERMRRQLYIVQSLKQEQDVKVIVYKLGPRATEELLDNELRVVLSEVYQEDIDDRSFADFKKTIHGEVVVE